MEVTEYEMPDSWNAKGMNWGNPDPGRADYVMAIRQALLERAAVLHRSVSSELFRISPFRTVSRRALEACVREIRSMAESFVNTDWDEYEDDLSDYPKMWTYRDLVQSDGCNVYEFAKPYDFVRNGGQWLKAIRKAIDKLTVIRCRNAYGTVVTRSGTKHDPPFGESIGTAMELAMAATPRAYSGSLDVSVYGWSGNTHWKWPRPKKDDDGGGLDDDDEEDKNGYCGYAQSRSYTITSVSNWLVGRDCELLLATCAKRSYDPVPYSSILDVSTYDSGKAGIKEGTTFHDPIHVTSGKKLEIKIGDPDSIPKNSSVPTSEWDEDGNVIARHSCRIGYEATVRGLLDYGCRNGFRFQEEG